MCPNAGREWEWDEEKLEKLEGACLPLQEQLHNLGTAVHRWEKWEKTGKIPSLYGFVALWPYRLSFFGGEGRGSKEFGV